MDFAPWSAVIGLLLIVMALSDTVLARLPLSSSMLYLAAGAAASPLWLGWSHLSPATHTLVLERMAEVVVLLSLFGSGLKMSVGLTDGRWLLPLRLAVGSMLITVGLIAAVGVAWLGLSLGAAILLGGILAPTDPVLASDVQVGNPADRDRLRFSLTGEAGLNDGTAYPFVLLGLGLLGLHDIGPGGWRWLAVDVVWGVTAGLLVGAAFGVLVGRLVLYLRSTHQEAVGRDNFLALGLIGMAYGGASMVHGYGFLAVFAAGVALRRVEQRATRSVAQHVTQGTTQGTTHGEKLGGVQVATQVAAAALARPDASEAEKLATDPEHAPAYMAHAMLRFNEQIERIAEVAAVVALGMLLWAVPWHLASWVFVAGVLLLIRPIAVLIGLVRSKTSTMQRGFIGWFGIRGIGSLYYLMYAVNHGIDKSLAAELTALTISVMVVSIVVHGVSVTPLMAIYDKAKPRARAGARR